MNVGELKKALETLNDNDLVVRASNNGLEKVYSVRLEQITDNFDNDKKIQAVILD